MSDVKIDSKIKEFLFHSLSDEQLKNLRDSFSKKDNSGLDLKPHMEMKLYHQVFSGQ